MSMDFINPDDYLDALADAIGAAWPETVENGVYLPGELGFVAWDDKVRAGELPVAVMTSNPRADTSGVWGITNYVWLDTVTLSYVQHRDWVNRNMTEKIRTMLNQIVNADLGLGQRLGTPIPVYDLSLPVNQFFVATGRALWSFGVQIEVMVGMHSQ